MPSHHSAARHLISKGIFDDLDSFRVLEDRLSALGDENSKVVGDALVRRGRLVSLPYTCRTLPPGNPRDSKRIGIFEKESHPKGAHPPSASDAPYFEGKEGAYRKETDVVPSAQPLPLKDCR